LRAAASGSRQLYLGGDEELITTFDSAVCKFSLDSLSDLRFVTVSECAIDMTISASDGFLYSLSHFSGFRL